MKLLILLLIIPSLGMGKEYIPIKAFLYIPLLHREVNKIFPSFKFPSYFASLVEQESCTYLTNTNCWSPTSRLKTSREEGAGLSQLTRAYTKTGKLRFDTVRNLRNKYKTYLKDLTWRNIYQRPDLQMRAMILLWKSNFLKLPLSVSNNIARVSMADAAYNGGLRSVFRDRRICGLKAKCNPDLWFNNVSTTCSKSKRILYGNRSACDINRDHVTKVIKTRYKKYQQVYCYYKFNNKYLYTVPK